MTPTLTISITNRGSAMVVFNSLNTGIIKRICYGTQDLRANLLLFNLVTESYAGFLNNANSIIDYGEVVKVITVEVCQKIPPIAPFGYFIRINEHQNNKNIFVLTNNWSLFVNSMIQI